MKRTRGFLVFVAFLSIAVAGPSRAEFKNTDKTAAHAVLVTYENDTPADQLKEHPDNIAFAKALKKVTGLISKTWINDGKTFGGFYVFTDKAAADAYINGDLFQGGVVKDPTNRNLQIKHFAVFSKLTAMSGVPSKTLSGQ